MSAESPPDTRDVRPLVVALTGASGALYALRLLDVLLAAGRPIELTISPSGRAVLEQETGVRVSLESFEAAQLWTQPDGRPWWTVLGGPFAEPADSTGPRGVLQYHHHQDFMSSIASGSHRTAGMVICPCSGGTLSGVVHGSSGNLIHRAAEVHLKERRPLIVVPRETPVSTVFLDNLRRAAEVGAVVLPAMPGWYHGVRSLHDLVDFIVARILDQLGVDHRLMRRWGETP